jgi:hypothetical protein
MSLEKKVDALSEKFGVLSENFGLLSDKFDKMTEHMTALAKNVLFLTVGHEQIMQRLGGVDGRLDGMDLRFDGLEEDMRTLAGGMHDDIARLDATDHRILVKLDEMDQKMDGLATNERVDGLEQKMTDGFDGLYGFKKRTEDELVTTNHRLTGVERGMGGLARGRTGA